MVAVSMRRFFDAASGPMVCGVNDCCVAVADAIQDRFGVDLMAGRRDAYRTPKQAVKEARRRGNRTVAEAVVQAAEEAGFKQVSGTPIDWDLGIIRYFDQSTGREEMAPSVFIAGFWMVRTHSGAEGMKTSPQGILRYGV